MLFFFLSLFDFSWVRDKITYMKKNNIIAPLIIGLACGVILPNVALFAGILPEALLKFFPILLPILSLAGVWVLETFFKKFPALIQFGKSLLVGVLNSCIDMGVFDFLTMIFAVTSGWIPVFFKVISFAFGAVNSFFWNKLWTFQKKDTENKAKETGQFLLVTLGGLLIHSSIIYIMVNIIGVKFGVDERMWASIGNMTAVLVGFVWNFLGYKFIVFKK